MIDLLEYLYNLILENHLSLVIEKLNTNFASRYIPNRNMIIVNSNWKKKNELPFVVGHELGHYLNKDNGVLYYSSSTNNTKEEHQADLRSLELIFDYAVKRGNTFNSPQEFVENYGIPERMLEPAKELFEKDNDLIF